MKVLMMMAHPDDEIIFGWPIFQDQSIEKEILVCSSDLNNPERRKYAGRKYALFEVCKRFGVPVSCLDHPSEFYRVPPRLESERRFRRRYRWRRRLGLGTPDRPTMAPLSALHQELKTELLSRQYDYIFTHNPLGEYGHLDHRLVFQIVFEHATKPVLITDICLETNWPSHGRIPSRVRERFYFDPFRADCRLDQDVYETCESIYRERKAWTWNREAVRTCCLYRL